VRSTIYRTCDQTIGTEALSKGQEVVPMKREITSSRIHQLSRRGTNLRPQTTPSQGEVPPVKLYNMLLKKAVVSRGFGKRLSRRGTVKEDLFTYHYGVTQGYTPGAHGQ
jgi:hypothetical protein